MQQQNSFWLKLMRFFPPTLRVVVIWLSLGSSLDGGDVLGENNAILKGKGETRRRKGFAVLL